MNRPSSLAIDLHLTEEDLNPDVAAWLLTDEGMRYRSNVDASTAFMGPFRRDLIQTVTPVTANNTRWFALVALAIAAVALFVVLPSAPSDPTAPYVGVRGGQTTLSVLDGGVLVPWKGQPLGSGDVVGLSVDHPGHSTATVVSIDGDGSISVLYPSAGEAPPRLEGPTKLPGSLTLDGAPGPEFFIVNFDSNVETSVQTVKDAWEHGKADAIRELVKRDTHVVEVPRR